MGNEASVMTALVGFMGSVIVALVSGIYLSRVEPTKSSLKKAEMLFDLKIKAAREFNVIYQKYSPLNLGELHDGDFYGIPKWDEIRESISNYKIENGFIFEDDKILEILNDILSSLDYNTPEYIALNQNKKYQETHEIERYRYEKTLELIANANKNIREHLFKEAKK